MQVGKYAIRFHPITVHFTNALYPISLLFLVLYLVTKEDSYRITYGYIITLAALSTPVSFTTGYIEWKEQYGGAKVRVFRRKLQLGLVLTAVGASCALWYWTDRGALTRGGIGTALFTALNFAVLPLTVYLGYLGGRLVYWRPH